MDLYLLDENLQKIDLIDYSQSVIWHTLYCGAGDFDISIPASAELFSKVREGCFFYRKDDPTLMIVEKIELQTNEESVDLLVITGGSAEKIIGRRIVWSQTILNGRVCECTRRILTENLIDPVDPARKIGIVKMGECVVAAETMQKQITGDNLLDATVEILSTYGLGFRLQGEIERLGGTLYFRIIRGTDRSKGNAEGNPVVKFSKDFDNLIASDYVSDYTEYKNVCLVAGEGEGTARRRREVGVVSGLSRREMYYDNNGLSSNEGEIGEDDYNNMLDEAGKEQLAETKVTQTFSGEIDQLGAYKYGEDFFLGDIVTIENEYGISANVRITGVTENKDENGHNVVLSYTNI